MTDSLLSPATAASTEDPVLAPYGEEVRAAYRCLAEDPRVSPRVVEYARILLARGMRDTIGELLVPGVGVSLVQNAITLWGAPREP